jgi:UDP-glucose 4-epimerase
MKIIVTGDTGLIGSHLTKSLYRIGHEVHGISRGSASAPYFTHAIDLEKEDIKGLFNTINPDIVIHLAAIPTVKNFDNKITEANCLMTHRILDACPYNCKFLFASSVTVYGSHSSPRSTYDTPNPSSVYALTKLYCENLIRLYANTYRKIASYSILRYVAHVGGNSRHGVVHDILRKLKQNSTKIELIGNKSPGSIKPYIHIRDSIKATTLCFGKEKGIYNVSPNDNISVLDIVKIVLKKINLKNNLDIHWSDSGDWPGDDKYVSIESDFGFIRDSQQAISDYIDEIKDCSDWF